ncbi:MAG: diadenylate cyclase [Desulfovibrionaceae bacterium]|nr:diadenylate cyclase [Desulfovibrionaceae bacterium]
MHNRFAELLDNWPAYTQKIGELYVRLGELLTDLGINRSDVRIIAFISSAWRGELMFYDSNGISGSSQQYLKTDDKHTDEEHLIKLFDIKAEHTLLNLESNADDLKSYDEFGIINHGHENICAYGIIIQYPQLESSKIIFELLNQISLFCKNVLDNENFVIEEYMLSNIVYVSLKKQIDIDFYNTLASSPYEKKVASGGILLANAEQDYDLKLSFNETYPLEVKNVKQIRKLLEMTTDKIFLVSKDGHAIGVSDYINSDDNFELFIFNGHQRWSYYKNGKELLSYKEGKYTFVFESNNNFVSYFPNGFINKNNYGYLNIILHEIKQLRHGTLLIISDDAQSEVERLCMLRRGYSIKPVDFKLPVNRYLLSSITSIDGAVFLDTNFICHGIGMILDGVAVKTGVSERGARYNSAQCYIDNKPNEKFTAVVVSDDEIIDILYNKKQSAP